MIKQPGWLGAGHFVFNWQQSAAWGGWVQVLWSSAYVGVGPMGYMGCHGLTAVMGRGGAGLLFKILGGGGAG